MIRPATSVYNPGHRQTFATKAAIVSPNVLARKAGFGGRTLPGARDGMTTERPENRQVFLGFLGMPIFSSSDDG